MPVNSFPDGVAPDAVGFIPNPAAPEKQVPEHHGEDLTWVGPSHGYQPITATNPDGDYPGVPLSSPGVASILPRR
jgi:hypothetical protein